MGKTIVILDSGHNKNTSGKQSPDGSYKEYEFNIVVRDLIAGHLKRHGVETRYVDSDNRNNSKELEEIIKQANAIVNSIYVSIHTNAYGNGWTSPTGWEIYCYGKNQNSQGYKLAKAIHDASIPELGLVDRGIKDGSHLYVIRKTTMPSVLIEHGFHTNKAECEKLKSLEFRKKIAICDAKGILNYLGIKWIEETVVEEKPVAEKESKGIYRVQVGAFSTLENAEKFADGMKLKGYSTIIKTATVNGKKIYRVQVGVFSNRQNAVKYADGLNTAGYSTTIQYEKKEEVPPSSN